MSVTRDTDGDQAALWNGASGRAWVDAQDLLDQVYEPFEDVLVRAAAVPGRSRVLDVGCGTGGTTVAIARSLGAESRTVGIDIATPMIDAARARAAREGSAAEFVCANAQDHAFEAATFDTIVSRFGVMFFDDPVAAFANLRRAAADGGVLRLVVWRSADDNPFMTTAERAAAPLLPNLPPRQPDAPGQFAFANAGRVHAILEKSGWTDIEIGPIERDCALTERQLVSYFSRLGPVGRALQDADDETRARVVDRIRPAFDAYVQGPEVRFTAACWMICARA